MLAEYKAFQNYLSTYCREVSSCLTVFRRYQVIVHARRCHLLERRNIFCFFAESFNAFFGMTFHIVTPSSDLFQRMFFFRLVFFRQLPLSSSISWTSRFRNELLEDQPLPLFACNPNALDLSLALDIRGRFLSAELSTWVHCVAPFQPFLYHPHTPVRKIRASCAREDTLQVGTFLPSFFWNHFFTFSYPNKAGQWVTT